MSQALKRDIFCHQDVRLLHRYLPDFTSESHCSIIAAAKNIHGLKKHSLAAQRIASRLILPLIHPVAARWQHLDGDMNVRTPGGQRATARNLPAAPTAACFDISRRQS